MGVNDLWQILEPVKEHVDLKDLAGKTIAVDLSLWVCEAQAVKKMKGTVPKPHLRNLFFRISYLTQMDIKLVFVMEGEPPRLKADVINKRNQIRYGPSGKTSQKTERSHFKLVLQECLDLLKCLGVPWVQAAGEAEAMCAHLNAEGQVDGCFTNDGDAFLYGAQTVYRNFTMNAKDPHVDCYTMTSIRNNLGLDRDTLIGLAILLGCDYLPEGVPGVGKEKALKLIQSLKGQNLLQRFNQWNEKSSHTSPQAAVTRKPAHCSLCSHPGSRNAHERNGCKLCKSSKYCEPHGDEYCCPCEWHQTEHHSQPAGIEESIKKKACQCEGFPFQEVIEEFQSNRDSLAKEILYHRPDLLLFQKFAHEKMQWSSHYACKKLLELLTRYDMVERKLGRRNSNQLQPIRIVKNRIRRGVHCFEIAWEKPEHYVTKDGQKGDSVVSTVEEESLFEAAYPEIVAVYKLQKLEIKGKPKKGMKIKPRNNNLPDSDDAVSVQSQLTLKPAREIFPKQNSELNLEIPPIPALSQEASSASLNNLLLPEDNSCLNTHEQFISSPRLLAIQQKNKAATEYPTSEAGQHNSLNNNRSVIADLHLSTIDWEGTSFSNSPAIQRNTVSCDLKSTLTAELSATTDSYENIQEQLCESEQFASNMNEASDWDLQKISSEEHLISSISNLCLKDLPLRERLLIKSSFPQNNVQPDVDLKTVSLIRRKESCVARNSFDYPPQLSQDLPGIHLQNESRNSEMLKDQLLQENCEITSSAPLSDKNPTAFRAGPPNITSDHNRKFDMPAMKKAVMQRSVCLERQSSDDESTPVFERAKFSTNKIKHGFQNNLTAKFKENDHNNLPNPKLLMKETEKYNKSFKRSRNEEDSSSGPGKKLPSSPQCHQKGDHDSSVRLDSPPPLAQRLKLKFQNT
ncbi:LOW QUALITY PROTEIN: flap endonuclease GEN homolog 1 [Ochotona curzoniae]|uniref:LOW QUALITY PROTEIN: flap endonuclease GEN homolog 1 n=1 Tax=Ochotona curzoniae TaxID=130825 RepID=UPI001B351025|nr:LOW QUALITY PROTEIN: flap endonuclease GEN homolog 1 [Ochotona curzoniae]